MSTSQDAIHTLLRHSSLLLADVRLHCTQRLSIVEGDEHARDFDTCAAQLFSELGEQRNGVCTRDVQVTYM